MALPATDSFTDTDGVQLTSHGTSWSKQGSYDPDIQSNAVAPDAASIPQFPYWNADTFDNDQYAQFVLASVSGLSASVSFGPAVRCLTNLSCYTFVTLNNTNYLLRYAASTPTQLGSSASHTAAVSEVFRIEVSGTTITPTIDGSTTGTPGAQTDSGLSSGNGGMYAYGDSTTARADDWEAGDLGGADALTASDVTSGTPIVDTTTIGQTHALTSADVTAGAPTTDTPTIGQTHVLSATEVTSGTPTLDAPTLTEPQQLSPASDISDGNWTPSTGVDLYAMVDENPAVDGDYIRSGNNPSNDQCEMAFDPGDDPESSTDHIIYYRYYKVGSSTVNLTFYLMEGVTQRATWSHNDIGASVVGGSYTLSGAEADSITNYANLRIRIEADVV